MTNTVKIHGFTDGDVVWHPAWQLTGTVRTLGVISTEQAMAEITWAGHFVRDELTIQLAAKLRLVAHVATPRGPNWRNHK